MSLCVNPARIGVRVNVEGGHLVYFMRQPTSDEYCTYKRSRVARIEEGGQINLINKSEEELIKYIDKLLVDVKGYDEEGVETDAEYILGDKIYPMTEQNREVWIPLVPPAVKFQVGQLFEYVEAVSLHGAEKNS